MISTKARIFNFLMTKHHIFRGKLKKDVFDFNTSIEDFREMCEKGATKYAKIPPEIKIKPDSIDGIKSEWLIPPDANPEKLILYVHGGGYVSGSCNDHRGFVAKFAKSTGIICLTYEYRLAPEFPFPAAVDDSLRVYKNILEKDFKPENIIIAGESAGGGLTLAILLALKENKLPIPKAAVAISPWTDLTCSGESYKTKNRVSAAPVNSWVVFSKYYIGDNIAANPLISPLYGDLKGLPPLFINSGESDELFDDGKSFFLKAKEAGVDVTFRAGEKMLHCYPLLAPFFPEATKALDEIIRFINLHLKEQ